MMKKETFDTVTNDTVSKFFEGGRNAAILHFTHGSDADGIGCEALSEILNENGYHIEIVRLTYNNMRSVICERLEEDACPTHVLITDLSVDEAVRSMLIEKRIQFLWIDHHTVNPTIVDDVYMDSRFIVCNGEYNTRLFDPLFLSAKAFNPRRYTTGTIKYSAFALYYLVIRMLNKVSSLFSESIEEVLVEPLSNADTYHFKYLRDTNGWIPTEDGDDCEGLPKSMTTIADVYPLILKHQGAEALIRVIKCLINDRVDDLPDLFMHTNMARLSHQKRVDEYKFFKRSCMTLMVSGVKMAFTPNPTAEFSIFSSWLFEEDPSIDATFGVFMESRTVTMRSCDGPYINEPYDVADFCRRFFNGGGHVHAAGGKIEYPLLIDLMTQYYKAMKYGSKDREYIIRAQIIEPGELVVAGIESLTVE